MIVLHPGDPEKYTDFSSGMLCIPEELEPPTHEETEADGEVDAFVQALIESMSKALKGGTHG